MPTQRRTAVTVLSPPGNSIPLVCACWGWLAGTLMRVCSYTAFRVRGSACRDSPAASLCATNSSHTYGTVLYFVLYLERVIAIVQLARVAGYESYAFGAINCCLSVFVTLGMSSSATPRCAWHCAHQQDEQTAVRILYSCTVLAPGIIKLRTKKKKNKLSA
jgi:hypothetical protein